MAKTGWKYTKQMPAKGSTNMLKKSNASSKPGRTAPKKGDSNMRTADTIKRLKMYNNGKAIRNKEGKVVGGQFLMSDRAGDTKITSCKFSILMRKKHVYHYDTYELNNTDLESFMLQPLDVSHQIEDGLEILE